MLASDENVQYLRIASDPSPLCRKVNSFSSHGSCLGMPTLMFTLSF